MEELILLLKHFTPISERLEKHLRKIIKPYYFKKGNYLLHEGEVANHILYLQKGLVRSFSMHNGVEASNWFMKEGNVVISVESFLKRVPAPDSIQALEDCVFWGITYDELEKTYAKFIRFERTGRLITNEYYCLSEARGRSQRRKTKEEKYAYMMATDPDLVARVVNGYMASYLDVSERTYDKMRSDYAEAKKRRRKR